MVNCEMNHFSYPGLKSPQIATLYARDLGRAILRVLLYKHHNDLVIMGNVSRAGVNGLFVGNTAEKILCRSDVSLLIVKPLAFSNIFNRK